MRMFLRRHLLWASLVAVLVPLSVLLVLQYRWLVDLQRNSTIAEQARLGNYLEGITTEVEYYYKSSAERFLNLPSSLFTQHKLGKAGDYFQKKGSKGAKVLFLISFVGHDMNKLLFYEPWFGTMEALTSLAEARAAYVATAPWEALSKEHAKVRSVQLAVDERDPENRIILNPILDEQSRVVGVTGMIIDQEYFRERFLPKIVETSMEEYFTDAAREHLVIHVHDREGRLIAGKEKAEEDKELMRPFTFVFSDYQVGISSRYRTPEELARAGFLLNMSLSAILAVVLLGVIVLALRAASREMKLSQMKSDFVSNVSHELRTPLASIRVFGEFLRLGRVESETKVREYGTFIETESRRLTGLVNNILDFSRIESGRKTYRFKLTDLNEVITNTLKLFDVRLRQNGYWIRRENEDEVPLIRVDPEAITQAVSNLVDNAVKYSGDSKEIVVRLGRDDGWAVISVVDHGIGITREEQTKIFERFHRVGTSLVHDVKGSGLGLSIVNHIVKAHQGEISVRSEPGAGSTFSVKLPIDLEITHA